MSESKILSGDYHEMGDIWARIYKQLTRFSRFILFKPAASTMQRIKPIGCFNLCHRRFVYIHLFPVI